VLLLISGASGAGKTTVRKTIAAELPPDVEAVELHHLDTIPANPDVAWRQRTAERAVRRAEALAGAGTQRTGCYRGSGAGLSSGPSVAARRRIRRPPPA
jgi:adenylate kinase family enzyme